MWEELIDDLEKRREDSEDGGGEEKRRKQRLAGKMTARDRVNFLLDEQSFTEIGDLAISRFEDRKNGDRKIFGDGVVTGYGTIDGRLVFVAAEDFTVAGGTLGECHALKICRIQDMALSAQAPFIMLNDSGGARIGEGVYSLSGYSGIFLRNTRASGVIPQIAAIMGPCSGGACYSPAICDFIFMVRDTSKMFITGPKVVKTVTGEEFTAEELGGAEVHEKVSGVAHFVNDSEKDCLAGIRKLLSYLPSNNLEPPPIVKSCPPDRCDTICDIVPCDSRKPYDVHKVIEAVVDCGSFLEIQELFAKNAVVGLSRIDGEAVGIVANQPSWLGGSLDCDSSDKIARFIRFCDCFRIPIVTLADVPAFYPGKSQEHAGIIRHGAKIIYAYAEAGVPKITLIMRKAYGGAYIAMNSKNMGADLVFAWPSAEVAVMGAEGAVDIIGGKLIAESDQPEETRRSLIEEYERTYRNPYLAAEGGFIDKVIKPEETRKSLREGLRILKKKHVDFPNKRHGNIPL